MKLTHGSLFAGIGGFDLGFERAGIETIWQVEINPFCRKVLERHWPNVQRFSDIRECGADNLRRPDVISGGFPCQDISYAGKGAGIDGERSGLWSEMSRIIGELRPRIAVVENVPALLGRGIGRVLRDLAGIGYDAEWDCLPACAFGATHSRPRLFLIAYPAKAGRQAWSADRVGETIQESEPLAQHPQWQSEPAVSRVVDGISGRVDRLESLGNAIVPQIAEWIGRRIVAAN